MNQFHTFLNLKTIYNPEQIEDVFKEVRKYFRFCYSNRKLKYFNVPCAFDIETSSFRNEKGEKTSIMYEWTFGIYGLVIIGRTWEQYEKLINDIVRILDLNENKRLAIYVHNLSFEFSFLQFRHEWKKVFAIDTRKPIYALTTNGIEYRCSYLLSGYSLEKLADNLQTYAIKKLVGDLDYEKIRHCETPLTDKEISYCVNDVKIVMAYIAEKIETDGSIFKIPYTKTGYVRNFCRNNCFYDNGIREKQSFKYLRYMEIMNGLRLSPDEYEQLKNAFQGGFTHCNPFTVA